MSYLRHVSGSFQHLSISVMIWSHYHFILTKQMAGSIMQISAFYTRICVSASSRQEEAFSHYGYVIDQTTFDILFWKVSCSRSLAHLQAY